MQSLLRNGIMQYLLTDFPLHWARVFLHWLSQWRLNRIRGLWEWAGFGPIPSNHVKMTEDELGHEVGLSSSVSVELSHGNFPVPSSSMHALPLAEG